MSPLDLVFHFAGFAAPALFVALAVAFAARWMGKAPVLPAYWARFAINFTVGVAALAIGLWHFGVDGKMATYAGLVLAVASAQWLVSRSWKA